MAKTKKNKKRKAINQKRKIWEKPGFDYKGSNALKDNQIKQGIKPIQTFKEKIIP